MATTETFDETQTPAAIDFGDAVEGTVVAPRPSIVHPRANFISIFWLSIRGIAGGLWTTLTYFFRPSTAVTQQYPENRETLKMFDRYRGKLELIHEESGRHRCTACQICQTACPNASIFVLKGGKNSATNKIELDQFIWRQDTCTFCNACVVECPFDALEMTGDFESSVYDRRLLVYNLNEYQGPCATQLAKIDDESIEKEQIRPIARYSGPVPLSGTAMDALPKLNVTLGGSSPSTTETEATS